MKPKFLLALEPLLIALSILAPVSAFSHVNLLKNGTLKPRDNALAQPAANKTPVGVTPTYNAATMDANPGETCGVNPNTGVLVARAAGQPVTNLRAGQQFTINWQETIGHEGWFQIWFTPNANDTGWIRLVDQMVDPAGAAPGTATFTVPNTLCNNCALRLIQVMIDNHPATPTYYYSCGNITITADGQPPAAGGSTGSAGSTGSGSSGAPDCP